MVTPAVRALLVALAREAPFHLGGGAALSGIHLHHRLSDDVDLFAHSLEATREIAR